MVHVTPWYRKLLRYQSDDIIKQKFVHYERRILFFGRSYLQAIIIPLIHPTVTHFKDVDNVQKRNINGRSTQKSIICT